MLSSILMFGSTYHKNNRLNIICALTWLIQMLMVLNLQTGVTFIIINTISFSLVFLLGRIFKGNISNKIIALFSILIWSVIIDSFCYFLYPEFTFGQNLLMYIANGIVFNYRFVFYNLAILVVVNGAYLIKKIRIIFKSRQVSWSTNGS